jgi:hypothetical protein
MALRQDEQVNLKGKMHPLWKGILREAMDNGLTELAVRLIQAPSEENGGSAICEATAVFSGVDGKLRKFVEIGDCDGKNCGAMIAPHRIRMAATRAKGRALRDALGIGEALAEEMGGESQTTPVADPEVHDPVCETCGADVEISVARESQRTLGGRVYCPRHKAELKEGAKAQGAPHCDMCHDPISEKVANASFQALGFFRCLECAKKVREAKKSAAAA